MPNLQHPDTGAFVRASHATAERLVEEEGYLPIERAAVEPASAAPAKPDSSSGGSGKPAASAATGGDVEKPLDKMKLTELIAHAEKIGVPAEQLDPLRKPGASKKAALAIISAHKGA